MVNQRPNFQDTHQNFKSGRRATRVALGLLVAIGLAACATGPKNPLTAQQIASLDIDTVEVTVFPGTLISWGAGEEAYAKTQGCEPPEVESEVGDTYNTAAAETKPQDCDYEAIVSSPEAQEFMANRVKELMEKDLRAQLVSRFEGTTPARVEVTIQKVQVVGGGQTLLVGGSHFLLAPLNVVDEQSGKIVAANPELLALAGTPSGGILGLIIEAASADPVERLTSTYAANAGNWIGGN